MIRKYRCIDCHNEFLLDIPVTSLIESRKHVKAKCPKCSSKKVIRLITDAPAVVFKGSGFYTTDKDDNND